MAQLEKVRGFLAIDTELSPVAALQYATFWQRVAAAAIDFGIVFAVQCVGMQLVCMHVDKVPTESFFEFIAVIIGDWAFAGLLLLVIFPWMYYAVAESGKYQATSGKRLLRLYVINSSGNHFSFARVTMKLALQSGIWLTLFCLLAKIHFAGHELDWWASLIALMSAIFAWTFHDMPHDSILAITAAYLLCNVFLISQRRSKHFLTNLPVG
jgi:uncharacterized RDD family membrane protein YckC